MQKPIYSFFMALLPAFFIVCPLQAAITIQPNFEGTLVITSPDGEINLIEPGDPMPVILSGSIVEVFDGEFEVTSGPGDQLEISCLEHDGVATDVVSLRLACGEDSGLLRVIAGTVTLATPAGEVVTLRAGDEYVITLDEAQFAPATAAGEGIGRPGLDTLPDVDSRSIAATAGDLRDEPASPFV